MNFHLPLIVLGLFLLACKPEPKEILQFYGTGEVARRHYEVNGKKEGVMTEYFKDGEVKGERHFEKDLQVGKTTYYYPGGRKKEIQYYDEGRLHGGDTLFYMGGEKQFMRHFNHGMLDGYIRKWAPDGSVIYEAKYRNDTLIEVKGEPVHPDSLRRQIEQLPDPE